MTSALVNARWFAAACAIGAAGCGFGTSIQRPDNLSLIENRGFNRYRYLMTRLAPAEVLGPATPVLAVPPTGAQEVGVIEVTVTYSGFGDEGLRSSETGFYSTLAGLAGELGGTHFVVLRTTREPPRIGTSSWITALTVVVLRAQL